MNQNHHRLFYKIIGEGEPIIILHGFLGSSDNWMSFAKEMAKNQMVILLDLQNHGRSFHVSRFTYEKAAEDVKQFMEEHWIHHAHILGHSMGGKVAMKLAEMEPDSIDHLIVVDITPFKYPGGHENILDSLISVNIESTDSRKLIEENLLHNINDPAVVSFLMKNLKRLKTGGFQWKMNLPVLHESYPEILKSLNLDRIDHPTLFIRGENSGYIPLEKESELRKIFSKMQLVTIKDSGHWVHSDQPGLLLSEVRRFLSSK
ncbi:MAG TPA: alpha/beta fold hydrolase [Saprospiraceae bacterium]|nr:alpha/beta fold hydrolase [Saprospiraceae bacterium]